MKRADREKLQLWQERLALAETAIAGERARMLRREKQYEGDHTIYAPDGSVAADSLASHVRNVSFEVIETQVDSTIPAPKVTAVRQEDEELASIIESMLRDVMDRLPSERLNDEGERLSPVQGGYGLLVDWLDSVSGKDWLGDLKVSLVHPYSIVPQAGVTQVSDMDFFFLKTPQTKRQIRKFYGVSVADEDESDPDARRLGASADTTDELVTMVTVYYRNAKGGIGRLRWVNDTVLEDLEDYQLRRVHRCTVCGAVGDGKKCAYCGSRRFEDEVMEDEELTEDITLRDGTVIPSVSEVRDELGQPVATDALLPQMQPGGTAAVIAPQAAFRQEPTRIPYYKPDVFPLVIRKNVSMPGRFWGSSDLDAIFDQQNSLNKICTKLNTKVLSGGSFTTVPTGARFINDRDGVRVEVDNPADLEKIRTFNTQVDISTDLTMMAQLYEQARQTIGITDSMQGRKDPTATSAVAKEFSAQQAAGRLESKRVMKRAMYQDLFEAIFKWMLAYCDEPRAIRRTDEHGDVQYVTFDRHDFLYRDEAGDWQYNTDFLFSCDGSAPLAADRQALWKETRMNFQEGALGSTQEVATLLRFWEQMEKLHYPMAGDMVKSLKSQMESQQAAQTMPQTVQAGADALAGLTGGGEGV
ncbi:portal protein [Vescimonas sp.]|uniref:portal protein n=1 Tax=Vescimonas sp. TaxID=2892404 RepID=UPI003F823579